MHWSRQPREGARAETHLRESTFGKRRMVHKIQEPERELVPQPAQRGGEQGTVGPEVSFASQSNAILLQLLLLLWLLWLLLWQQMWWLC